MSKDFDRRELDAEELLENVLESKREVSDEGRSEAVEKQHEQGKMTARERIEYLCDRNTFEELGQLAAPSRITPEVYDWDRDDAPADSVIAGFGKVDSRTIGITATDFTAKGGSIGHVGSIKQRRIRELSLRRGFPLVILHDGGGHRIQEGLDAHAYSLSGGDGFRLQNEMSGWVPQVSAMMGGGFAGHTNTAALCDFIPMVEGTSTMGIAGPSFVEAALGIDTSAQELGGAEFHATKSGMADITCENDKECLDVVKQFLSYLPQNAEESPPETGDFQPPHEDDRKELIDIIPSDPKKGYDIYDIVKGVIDVDSFFPIKPKYARSIITGFARMEGQPIGLVANNPKINAGTIDVPAADKMSHFISMCDAFGLPLVFLADIPGVIPGPDSEEQGIARHSGKILFELDRATVPKISIIMRRAYGFGFVVMAAGRHFTENDLTVAWPTAEIAAMGVEGAVNLLYADEIENAENPEAKREGIVRELLERTSAVQAVEGFGIDAVIDPRETRERIMLALDRSEKAYSKDWPPKKHGINPI